MCQDVVINMTCADCKVENVLQREYMVLWCLLDSDIYLRATSRVYVLIC